jgi:hypothetical protein
MTLLVKVERNKETDSFSAMLTINTYVFIVPQISISPLPKGPYTIILLYEMLNAATAVLIDSNTLSLSHKDFSLTLKVNETTRILEN